MIGSCFRSIVVFVCMVFLAGCSTKIIGFSPEPTGTTSLQTKVVQSARSQIGARYRAGGTTPRGFDCSGLIWWAYKQNGINVPRMTRDQAKAGRNVNRRSMQVGDILVFNTRQGRNGLHTGLYTGKGMFVHSPSSGKRVRQDSLQTGYWKKRLIRIRRVLN